MSHVNRVNQPGPTVHRLPEVFIIISSLVYKPIPLFRFTTVMSLKLFAMTHRLQLRVYES